MTWLLLIVVITVLTGAFRSSEDGASDANPQSSHRRRGV